MIYALYGEVSRDILTLDGRPIVHDNRDEMQFLMPQAKVIPVTEADLKARSPLTPLQLRNHPALLHITWPLDRKDFR
jgi:hypothetical protein